MNRLTQAAVVLALFALTAAMPPPSNPNMPGTASEPSGPGGPPMGPLPATTAAPTADPAMLAKAKNWFAQLQAGAIDRSQLATSANGNLTDATIANAKSALAGLGAPVGFVQQQAGTQGSINYAIYLVTFQDGRKLNFLFAVDQQGKIESLGLGTPH
jgi:hypothetical protein